MPVNTVCTFHKTIQIDIKIIHMKDLEYRL